MPRLQNESKIRRGVNYSSGNQIEDRFGVGKATQDDLTDQDAAKGTERITNAGGCGYMGGRATMRVPGAFDGGEKKSVGKMTWKKGVRLRKAALNGE